MNGRQAAKKASKKIEELEHYNSRCKQDIKAYNKIITGLIVGNLNPCDWCEENKECEKPEKGKGCADWWLKYDLPQEEEEADDSKDIPFVGAEGRA